MPKPRRKFRRPLLPTGVALGYYAELREIVQRARKLVRERLVPKLPELLAQASELHTDAADVNKLMEQIAASLFRAYSQERLERIAAKYATATSNNQRDQFFNQMKEIVGIDLSAVVDRRTRPAVRQFVKENVALIKTVPRDYFADVEREVLRGVKAGDRASEIEEKLEERAGVARNRSALIARDQVLKFNGDLNRMRQQDLGVERYIWRGADDGRERVEHLENNDQIFRWDDPPGDPDDPHIGTHPGTAINCRCWAQPVVEDLVGDLTDDTDSN